MGPMTCCVKTVGGIPTSGGGGSAGLRTWTLMETFDFTEQASFDIRAAGDGTHVIGGLSWTALNMANSSEFQVINGTGLRMTQPAGTARAISNATNDGPQIRVDLSALWPGIYATADLCIQGVIDFIDPPDQSGGVGAVHLGYYGPAGVPSTGAVPRYAGAARVGSNSLRYIGVTTSNTFGGVGSVSGGIQTLNFVGCVAKGNGEMIALGATTSTPTDPSLLAFRGCLTNQFGNSFSAYILPASQLLIGTSVTVATGTAFQAVIERVALWMR